MVFGRFSCLHICRREEIWEFIAGGRMMDDHFLGSEYQDNIPVLLALIGIWYNNFLHSQSYAVVPFSKVVSIIIYSTARNGKQWEKHFFGWPAGQHNHSSDSLGSSWNECTAFILPIVTSRKKIGANRFHRRKK